MVRIPASRAACREPPQRAVAAGDEEVEPNLVADPAVPVAESGTLQQIIALARYMTKTEVHTYAFSVAAQVILSLFPFIVLLLTLCSARLSLAQDGQRRRADDDELSAQQPGLRDAQHEDPCHSRIRRPGSSRS